MEKIFEIHPKRPISGVLPNMRRIMDITRMPLSEKEFLRCMNSATLYALAGNDAKVLVTDLDYKKALSLFESHEEYAKAIQTQTEQELKEKSKPISSEPLPVKIVNEEPKKEEEKIEETIVKEEVKEEVKVEEPVKEEKPAEEPTKSTEEEVVEETTKENETVEEVKEKAAEEKKEESKQQQKPQQNNNQNRRNNNNRRR